MNNIQYKEILTTILSDSNTQLIPGQTIIVLWQNEAHLEEWINVSEKDPDVRLAIFLTSSRSSPDVRILTVPTSHLPMIKVEGDINSVTVVGVGFSVDEDYSDTRLAYYMTVIPKK
jgi:hypothetical protein